jgi:hypothetical protein
MISPYFPYQHSCFGLTIQDRNAYRYFKTEVLFDLVDTLYRQKHGLTVTSNYLMRDLEESERLHPAIIRRLDDRCRVIEL